MILHDYFSGIGGFHLGLERAGFKFDEVCFSEVDKHAIANYKYNFKDAKYIGAIESVCTSGARRPNIITFGSPCQDFSLAGKREGMGGARSSLITDALSAVSHFRPDVFIWENVKGTFSSNGGRDFYAIMQAIANIGGYECEWQLVNTSWLLPQNRERIYLVGHLAASFRDWRGVFPFAEDNQQNHNIQGQSAVCNTITARQTADGGGSSFIIESQLPQEGVIHVKSATLKGHEEATVGDSIDLQFPNSKTRRGRVGKGISHTLDCACNQGVSLSEPTHKHGEERVYTNIAPTVQARYGTGGDNIPYVNNIRRLTEIECERLQGFPDNWTQYGNYDGEVKKISKTQRYKMCGNAVTAEMVKLIGSKIIVNFENNNINNKYERHTQFKRAIENSFRG